MLKANVLEAANQKARKLYKNAHQYVLLLLISHQPAILDGEGSSHANFGSWSEKVKKYRSWKLQNLTNKLYL